MASKTLSTLLIVILLIFAIPAFIGLLGGAFGIIMGVFGVVVGVFAGIVGAIAGVIGWFFKMIFGLSFVSWNFFAILFVAVILILVTKRSRS